ARAGAVAARRAAQRARHGGGGGVAGARGGLPGRRRQGGDRLTPAVHGAGAAAARARGLRAVRVLAALLRRDLAQMLGGGRRGGALLPVLFFLTVAMLFPFAVGPNATLLARTGGGVIWVAALLAAILPLDRLLAPDVEQGFFDQWALRGIAEEAVVMVRVLAHWLSFGPPLMLAAVPASALLGIDGATLRTVELG